MQLPRIIVCWNSLVNHEWYYTKYPFLSSHSRHYLLGSEIGSGRVGKVFEGQVCDSKGVLLPDSPKIVIKVPKIEIGGHRTIEQIRARVEGIRNKNREQLVHINKRLAGCPHFNPIIDLSTVECDEIDLPITIQPFLGDASSLDEWLHQCRQRELRRDDDCNGKDQSEWWGIKDRRDWCMTSLVIAHALKEIHMGRVVHGDVHPGNIFLTNAEPTRAIFIDFGESFVATPEPVFRNLKFLKAYHAPELAHPTRTNESLDVYSFGILLLYLATGREVCLNSELATDVQRQFLERTIREKNPGLLAGEPRILDLIAGCTMTDPANRPRMADVGEDLARILDSPAVNIDRPTWNCCPHASENSVNFPLPKLLEMLTEKVKEGSVRYHPVLLSMLKTEVEELTSSFAAMHTEMVDLYGSRDRMLRVLISLMDSLQKGDSWTSATTLNVWQGSALGLAGRFSSACIRAILRGSSVRRSLIISVEELGLARSQSFSDKLLADQDPDLRRLGSLWASACQDFRVANPGTEFITEEVDMELKNSLNWPQERFRLFLSFWAESLRTWLSSKCEKQMPFDITKSQGFLMSLCPVGTRNDAEKRRSYNPAALMHLPSISNASTEGSDENTPSERVEWLLVTAETRGRRDANHLANRPHLIGIRVHPSVFGVPEQRIRHLSHLFSESVNVTPHLDHLVALWDLSDSH